MPRHPLLCFALFATILVSSASAQKAEVRSPAKPSASREQWRTVYLGGVNVGYLHNTVATFDKNGRSVVVNEQVSVMAVALPRHNGAVVSPSETRTKITIQTEETKDGDVLAFRYQVQNPPLLSTRKVGRVADGSMQIETESGGK